MKKLIFLILIALVSQSTIAQKKIWDETQEEKDKRLGWWRNDRFGMFIHWGTYALAGRHEWVKKHERIPDEEYTTYFENFNPDLYDPSEWARLARAAGMKYA